VVKGDNTVSFKQGGGGTPARLAIALQSLP